MQQRSSTISNIPLSSISLIQSTNEDQKLHEQLQLYESQLKAWKLNNKLLEERVKMLENKLHSVHSKAYEKLVNSENMLEQQRRINFELQTQQKEKEEILNRLRTENERIKLELKKEKELRVTITEECEKHKDKWRELIEEKQRYTTKLQEYMIRAKQFIFTLDKQRSENMELVKRNQEKERDIKELEINNHRLIMENSKLQSEYKNALFTIELRDKMIEQLKEALTGNGNNYRWN